MKKEYDFSKGQRGKFYRSDVELNFPVYLESDVARVVRARARKRDVSIGAVVNEWLRKDIRSGGQTRRQKSFSSGYQKRTGSDGTRRSKPTLRLEGSISWSVRRARSRPRGISRTLNAPHDRAVLGLLWRSTGAGPEGGPTETKCCSACTTPANRPSYSVRKAPAASRSRNSNISATGNLRVAVDARNCI